MLLNLLKSFYLQPVNARFDFFFKVILPSISHDLLVWRSCNNTLFDELERIPVRAARTIYRFMWSTPTEQVFSTVKCIPVRLYFSGIIYHNLPDYLANRLQRVQTASTSFVLGLLEAPRPSSNSNGYQLWNSIKGFS